MKIYFRHICFALITLFCLYPLHGHTADSTSFNPVPIAVAAEGAGALPIGTIITWPVSTNPQDMDKWLECNGQSTNGYLELAAIVGATVPNYQGMFLRGRGTQTFNSGGYGNVLHAAGALGQIQGDAIRNVTGSFATDYSPGHHYAPSGAFFNNGYSPGRGWDEASAIMVGLDFSRSVPTATENRPGKPSRTNSPPATCGHPASS
jgi:hypothetical protein